MINILVVDDNEENRYLLKVIFESNGYKVTLVNNGNEALEAARSSLPDLVISDILMPGMDGFSLCRQWKTDDQLVNIPFLFYTATYTDAKDEDFALSLGAERFIRKPAEPNQLIGIIHEVLTEKQENKTSETPVAVEQETVYFKKYNEALIRKMEDKMLELEKVNERLSALFQASVELTSLMPKKDFISLILNKIIHQIDGLLADYFEFNETKKEFQLQANAGSNASDLEKYQKDLVFHLGEEHGLVGLVGLSREPLILNDTRNDPRWINANKSIRSALFLPMVCEKRLIGVLSILSTTPDTFDQKFSRDMATLANNLAIAVDRSHFLEEIQQNEKALLENEKFLNNIIENIPNMLFVKDAKELRFVRFNKAGEELLGYSKQEMQGKNDYDLFPKDEADVFYKKDKEALKNNLFIDIPEEKIQTRYKGERILHTKKIPILDEQGMPKYLLGISEDITKQKRSEQLLNALNQAAVVMATALTPLDIFTTVACELRKLDLSCLLFPIEDVHAKLFSTYLDSETISSSKAKDSAEVKNREFLIPIEAVSPFKQAIFEKKSIFVNHSDEILTQIFPKFSDNVSKNFSKLFGTSKILVAPLVIEDKVIGIFLVQSINLTPEDTPAVTAFANQLAAAWNKAKLTTKLQNTISGIIQTIALIVETRDPYTAGHQKRVSALAAAIGEEMDLPSEKIEAVRIASLIHDLGKIHIPAEILSKPGKLTPLEYDLVKIHPQVGFDLLKNIDFPWPIAQIILQHHEKMNGSGYPQGLSRDEILIESRILAVADVIEAMSSHRPYRPALGFEAAKEEVVSKKNQLYDSIVVDACIKVFEKGFNFPAD